jgi:hypothetical protein
MFIGALVGRGFRMEVPSGLAQVAMVGRRGLEPRTSAVTRLEPCAYNLRELGWDERCSRCYVATARRDFDPWQTEAPCRLAWSTRKSSFEGTLTLSD